MACPHANIVTACNCCNADGALSHLEAFTIPLLAWQCMLCSGVSRKTPGSEMQRAVQHSLFAIWVQVLSICLIDNLDTEANLWIVRLLQIHAIKSMHAAAP